MRELSGLALAVAAGFLAAYFLQAKGFHYQLLPTEIFAAAGGIFALAGVLDDRSVGGLKKPLILPTMIATAVAALSFTSQVYRGSPFNNGVEIAQYRPGARSFFIASTNLYNGFPVAVRENLLWASRFPTLWLVPYVADRWREGPLPDDPIIAYALEATVTDLQKFRPDVVFINQSTSQSYIKGGTFDYLKFLRQDSRFAMIWSNYELRGQVGKFAVYVVKSP